MFNLVVTFTASILIWLMFVGLIVLWLVDGRYKKELVLHAVISCLFAWVVCLMLKDIFPTPRPYLMEGSKSLVFFIPKFEFGTFPSTHAAASFALSLTIWFHDKKVGYFYLFSSVLIGIARVIANVHYPLDIIGGGLLGMFTSFLIGKIHFFPSKNK